MLAPLPGKYVGGDRQRWDGGDRRDAGGRACRRPGVQGAGRAGGRACRGPGVQEAGRAGGRACRRPGVQEAGRAEGRACRRPGVQRAGRAGGRACRGPGGRRPGVQEAGRAGGRTWPVRLAGFEPGDRVPDRLRRCEPRRARASLRCSRSIRVRSRRPAGNAQQFTGGQGRDIRRRRGGQGGAGGGGTPGASRRRARGSSRRGTGGGEVLVDQAPQPAPRRTARSTMATRPRMIRYQAL